MDYRKVSDLELWKHCQNDDYKAFNALFDRYAPKLYKQVTRHINDKMLAEEMVMDFLFHIWQRRHTQMFDGSIAAYFYQSMRNQIVSQLRRKVLTVMSIDTFTDEHFIERRQADYETISAEANQVYNGVLQKLPPQQREVFLLSRDENLTYAQIAERKGLSTNTVRNYMVAALDAFRNATKILHT